MSREVDRILADRARGARAGARSPEMASFMGALALHGLFIAVAVLLPRFNPPPPQLEFVPVQIIPAQA
ncbi:MAG TPA: hypothetical protein VE078_01725, partial [Thermoanaerobaculia bacterium]|nr:hypothetical protein [Thermoanaerobaculia bacterium]